MSKVYGQLPEPMKAYLKVEQGDFFACGISLVIHPNSPLVPTVHANFRYFELYDNNKEVVDASMTLLALLYTPLMKVYFINERIDNFKLV